MLRLTLSTCLIALSVVACSSPGSEEVRVGVTEGVEPRIVSGTTSPVTQDSVVYVFTNNGYCTGTLVTPNLVLTARHCVTQVNSGSGTCGTFQQDTNPGNLAIATGASANGNSSKVAKGTAIFHEASTDVCGSDIALIQLSEDVPGAVIAPLRFAAVAAGATGYTAVGYGKIDNNGDKPSGRLERSGLAVAYVGAATYDYVTQKNQSMEVQVAAGEFSTGESTCSGDDGSPLFDASGNIVGLDSRGIDNDCQDRPTIWSDVVSHQTLIVNAAQTAGHALTITTTSGADAGARGPDDDAGAGIGPSPTTSGASNGSSDNSDGELDESGGDGTGSGLIDPNQGTGTTTSSGCALSTSSTKDARLAFFGIALGAMLVVRRRRAR